MKLSMMKKLQVLLCAALVFAAEFAMAQAATVFDVSGTAQATSASGAARTLRKGDAVNQGETVVTGDGSNVVLKFEDGQVVALAARSRFAITNYTYNKTEPAKSNVLLSLLDGGMRAITGLIGKSDPSRVSYRAANATIGIRGTDITVGTVGGNLAISVTEGGISFVFQGKTTTVSAGEGVDARTDGTLRKAALNEFYASLSPEMKAVFTDADNRTLDRLIRQAGQQDLRENPLTSATPSTTGTTGASGTTGVGGGSPSTR